MTCRTFIRYLNNMLHFTCYILTLLTLWNSNIRIWTQVWVNSTLECGIHIMEIGKTFQGHWINSMSLEHFNLSVRIIVFRKSAVLVIVYTVICWLFVVFILQVLGNWRKCYCKYKICCMTSNVYETGLLCCNSPLTMHCCVSWSWIALLIGWNKIGHICEYTTKGRVFKLWGCKLRSIVY